MSLYLYFNPEPTNLNDLTGDTSAMTADKAALTEMYVELKEMKARVDEMQPTFAELFNRVSNPSSVIGYNNNNGSLYFVTPSIPVSEPTANYDGTYFFT